MKKEIEAIASKLPRILSFLFPKDKMWRQISDWHKSIIINGSGHRRTRKWKITRINVDADTGVRFELEPSSSKVASLSIPLSSSSVICWKNIKSSSYPVYRGHLKCITVDK
jgi:hypothetical protein